jgi:hypothetical protein
MTALALLRTHSQTTPGFVGRALQPVAITIDGQECPSYEIILDQVLSRTSLFGSVDVPGQKSLIFFAQLSGGIVVQKRQEDEAFATRDWRRFVQQRARKDDRASRRWSKQLTTKFWKPDEAAVELTRVEYQ